LGRLKENSRNGVASLKTNYTYNIRSWLKTITGSLFNGTTYTYDKNGNMLTLNRKGNTGSSSYGVIDNLTLSYTGNRLTGVSETAAAPGLGQNQSNDFRTNTLSGTRYDYDLNGNRTKDLNQKISNITYNALNLPRTLTIDSLTNQYIYAADGRKLTTIHGSGSTQVTTQYAGNMVYENNTLKRILVDGGYIENGTYHYYLQDHLGNNRVVANASGTVQQVNHYYPYGMLFGTSVTTMGQPYKYGAKEFDGDKNLFWSDFEARQYYATVPGFTTIDPMAEKYPSMSPYVYCLNNPIRYIEIKGDSVRVCTETNSYGHSWMSVGESNDMVVYSYGRYNGTYKGADGSFNSAANGDGVLLRLTGDEAKAYLAEKSDGMSIHVITDVSDEKVADILDEKFNSSSRVPDNSDSKYYKNSSAHVVDEYSFTSNNCTTMISDVLNQSGSNVFKTVQYQQTSTLGTGTSFPVIKRFVAPLSLRIYLNSSARNNGVVRKTR
jgi:RHS repeat-associated protein